MDRTKTILIGLDGCDFRILAPLIEDGYLPIFSELLKNGCYGTLMSTLPPNTLPAWTSIFTGVNPGKHGITDIYIKEGGEFKIANSSYRMVDTIWAILNRFNLQQIIVNEPVTYPPEKINGVMLTGFFTPFKDNHFAYPSAIKDEINKICHGYEPDLPFGFEKTIATNKARGFELINEFANKIFKATMFLGTNYDWDLLSVIFTSTDRLQHFYFSDSEYIRAHYKLLDGFIKRIINLEPDANVILVSDHGFGHLRKCFYINTWLRDQNLAVENQSGLNALLSRVGLTYEKLVSFTTKIKVYKSLAKIVPMSIKRSIPQSTIDKNVDFSRSAIIFPGLNGGLFVDKSLNNHRISTLKEKLSSLIIDGERPIERVFMRNEVLWGPYVYRAANIFLVPKYGYEISQRLVSSFLSAPSIFGDIRTGTHRPNGVFLAHGPDISKGVRLKKPLFTWDIASTILHMFDVPIPNYMDGNVLKEAFKKGSSLAQKPVHYHSSAIGGKIIIRKTKERLRTNINLEKGS